MSTEENQQLSSAATMPGAVAEYIPFTHHTEWMEMDFTEQMRVRELLAVMESIKTDERGVMAAIKSIALANQRRRGWSFSNLRTLFYGWLGMNGDWRALARHYNHETSLPQAFIDYLRTKALQEHRSRKQAIIKIRANWREGKPVPGYGTWREWFAARWPDAEVPKHFAGDYPGGWKDRTLYNYMPSRIQHRLATRGRAAISGMLPKLQRDPGELRFLELVTIDDFETDVLAIYGRQVVRVRGLLAIDVATRTRLAVGFKPRVEGDEGQKISVNAQDMQFLLKSVFARWGVPSDYPMTLLVENAAASIGADLEAALGLHFGDQVRIERTGMLHYKTVANGFVERGGKPQEKGWIESCFNLWWNSVGSLPGQKGNRYDNAPGDLEARKKYVQQLAAYETTDEQWAQFRKPFLGFDALVIAFETAFDRMEQRTEHKMLGFERITEWRRGPGDEPKSFELITHLPADDQLRIEILPPRMESPAERRAKLIAAHKFVKVPEPVLALLAFTAKRVTVKNHHVTFTLRGEGYTYAQGGAEALQGRNGEEIVAYFDDRNMASIYCFSAEGAYLGDVRRWGASVAINDAAGISAAAEQLREFYQREVEGPVQKLLAGQRAEADSDRAGNESRLVQWRLKAPDEGKKRPSLAKTLAKDAYAEPAGGRFAAAAQTAGSIAASALQQQAARERIRSLQKAGNATDELLDGEPSANSSLAASDPSDELL